MSLIFKITEKSKFIAAIVMLVFLIIMGSVVIYNWNKFHGDIFGWIIFGALDAVIFCGYHFVTSCKMELLKA